MKNCQPNLRLFSQIFWVVVIIFIVLGYGTILGGNLLQGKSVLQDLNRAKACLLGNVPYHSAQMQFKKKSIAFTFIALSLFRLVQFKFKVKRFITGLCPNGRMSCVGYFKRNVISLNQCFWWFLWWLFFMTFCCISVDYGDGYLSAKTQFWIWNLSGFIGYEGLHLFLPLLLDVPGQGKDNRSNQGFYVRKPMLEPRKPMMPTQKEHNTFIYTKKYEPNPDFSKIQAPPSAYLFVKELQEQEGLSGISESNITFHRVRRRLGGIQESFSQF